MKIEIIPPPVQGIIERKAEPLKVYLEYYGDTVHLIGEKGGMQQILATVEIDALKGRYLTKTVPNGLTD